MCQYKQCSLISKEGVPLSALRELLLHTLASFISPVARKIHLFLRCPSTRKALTNPMIAETRSRIL